MVKIKDDEIIVGTSPYIIEPLRSVRSAAKIITDITGKKASYKRALYPSYWGKGIPYSINIRTKKGLQRIGIYFSGDKGKKGFMFVSKATYKKYKQQK